ncbi:hypothetical protein THS27_26310, partial [Thalassospira sp. MCCC 1A01428]
MLTGKTEGTGKDDIGTIEVHNNSNLTLGTGNIWLNDNITFYNYSTSVIVNSATIKLSNAIKITGNYTQTGGGLVVQAASMTDFGSLDVSGYAKISNTSLVISGNNLAVGDTYTIVGADNGGETTYEITTASVVGTSGLGATTATVGKDLVVTITEAKSGGYQSIGSQNGSVGGSLGATLDQINNSSSSQAVAFQNNVLAAINSLPSNQQG